MEIGRRVRVDFAGEGKALYAIMYLSL